MTRKRFIGFAIAAIVLALVMTSVALIAADLVLHQTRSAVNIWGYRGPLVGRKQPNEWRLAVVGESTAYGYGVKWDEAFPAYLQNSLNSGRPADRKVTVLNLAYNNEGAYSYKFTLRDYDYLQYDAVLFYAGYNDLGGDNTSVFRHQSPIFRMTGYLPLLPYFLHEKAGALRGGSEEEFADKTVFDPNLSGRASAAVLERAFKISRSLETQLNSGPREHVVDDASKAGEACGWRWSHYCGGMYQAISLARSMGKPVIVTTQPIYNWEHDEQQDRLYHFLQDRFGSDPGVRIADLSYAADLYDPEICWDGLHLTPKGNRQIAAALLPYVKPIVP